MLPGYGTVCSTRMNQKLVFIVALPCQTRCDWASWGGGVVIEITRAMDGTGFVSCARNWKRLGFRVGGGGERCFFSLFYCYVPVTRSRCFFLSFLACYRSYVCFSFNEKEYMLENRIKTTRSRYNRLFLCCVQISAELVHQGHMEPGKFHLGTTKIFLRTATQRTLDAAREEHVSYGGGGLEKMYIPVHACCRRGGEALVTDCPQWGVGGLKRSTG